MNWVCTIVTVWTASILTRGVIEYIKDPPEKGDARSNPAVIVACTSLATFLGDILLVFEAGEYGYKIGQDTKDAIKRFINELRRNPYPRGR